MSHRQRFCKYQIVSAIPENLGSQKKTKLGLFLYIVVNNSHVKRNDLSTDLPIHQNVHLHINVELLDTNS